MDQGNHTTGKRKWKQLSESERYKIEALYEQGLTPAQIGCALNPQRDRRTIERELKLGLVEQRQMNPSNNKYAPMYVVELVYKADRAQMVRDERASNKGRGLKIGNDHKLADYIESRIKDEKWSPDVVIGRLKMKGWGFKTTICTKTVYNYIDRGIFREVTNKDLWVKKNGSKKRDYKKIRTVALNNKNGKSITERPEAANDRSEPGHWEIDLVVGKQGTKPVILTLVERKTRKSLYVLVKNKTQKEVVAAIKRARRRVGGDFSAVFKTITADNGSEFLDSEAIKKAAKCGEVYYAHPYSSWERGSNENGNRILRRFVPKGMNIGKLTVKQLQRIEDWVNNYPRKIHGYKTANEMMVA
ncbi:MAG TPA: IS30 family transposase [Oscillospiraceae bacterium]|nr:IS30 family transposase [Oscillospiraceae bacterium]